MTIIFDCDGTLHKTEFIYGYGVRTALSEIHDEGIISDERYEEVKDTPNEVLAKYLGWTGEQMWGDFMPELTPEEVQIVRAKVGDRMNEGLFNGKSSLYEGVEDMLDGLKAKGYRLCILSNCRNVYMDAEREYFGFDKWFDKIYTGQDFAFAPKDEIFETIVKDFPEDSFEDYVMVGDRSNDIKVGETHGIKTIGCAYGYAEPGELSKASVLVNSPLEILENV